MQMIFCEFQMMPVPMVYIPRTQAGCVYIHSVCCAVLAVAGVVWFNTSDFVLLLLSTAQIKKQLKFL